MEEDKESPRRAPFDPRPSYPHTSLPREWVDHLETPSRRRGGTSIVILIPLDHGGPRFTEGEGSSRSDVDTHGTGPERSGVTGLDRTTGGTLGPREDVRRIQDPYLSPRRPGCPECPVVPVGGRKGGVSPVRSFPPRTTYRLRGPPPVFTSFGPVPCVYRNRGCRVRPRTCDMILTE